jgi:UDP-glucose 4-epimerase
MAQPTSSHADSIARAFAQKRVLITGGLGFIGSTLARRLAALGARVLLVDSLIPEYGGNLFNIDGLEGSVQVNISDVRDEHSFRYLVQGQNYLFNLAGQTSHLDSMSDPFADLEINCRAQLSILEACRKYNPSLRIVFASTRQIYGRPDYLPVDEKHLLRPVDVNGVNKMAGEWFHILYHNVYGIWSCALRLGNTYGPRMRIKDARQTFLGIWIRLVLEGRPFEIWGGSQRRDFTFVEDAVDAFLLAAADESAGGRIFNLGGDAPVTLRDLAALLQDVAGAGEWVERSFPPERKRIDIGDYYADAKAIGEALGWQPRTALRDGLAQTVAYYRQHLERYV